MPRTLGGQLFLIFAVLFWGLAVVNFVLAGVAFMSFSQLGVVGGFDRFTIFLCLISGFMFFGDMFTFSLHDTVFESLWPNIFIIFVRLAYLFVAAALFYGILVVDNSNPADWIFLSIASLFVLANLPWLIFHLALCVPKCRQYVYKMNEEMKCRLKTLPDTSSQE